MITTYTLLAVPFFILAGLLMSSGGIAKRLINLAMLVLGKVPGSLAMTNIAGNAMFGSISGSGIAAATAIGGVRPPASWTAAPPSSSPKTAERRERKRAWVTPHFLLTNVNTCAILEI